VGVGDLIEEEKPDKITQMMVRRVDNKGATVWTYLVGDKHSTRGQWAYSAGYSVVEHGTVLYVSGGIWNKQSNLMKAAIVALDTATGSVKWTTMLTSKAKHSGARSVIMDGERIIATGYTNCPEGGFLFVCDEGKPTVWELDTAGKVVVEKVLSVEGAGQMAKIRKDTTGFVMASTAWGSLGGGDVYVCVLAKLKSNLELEWSKSYGMAGGGSQVFDLLVDRDGNYLMGGHTTVGTGVVNWDYLAIKVDKNTKNVVWRKTFGQPRGFDPRYIHDEMYGVALDPAGNYLLLGGSGDEYPYSKTNTTTGWMSDVWVSYLVVVDTQGNTLAQGVYGDKGGNNAGEWLAVDQTTGEVMIFTDSDTHGGFGFLKLTPN